MLYRKLKQPVSRTFNATPSPRITHTGTTKRVREKKGETPPCSLTKRRKKKKTKLLASFNHETIWTKCGHHSMLMCLLLHADKPIEGARAVVLAVCASSCTTSSSSNSSSFLSRAEGRTILKDRKENVEKSEKYSSQKVLCFSGYSITVFHFPIPLKHRPHLHAVQWMHPAMCVCVRECRLGVSECIDALTVPVH